MANNGGDPGKSQTDHSVITELKRREVFKTAGIYAGGAWLLTEILLAVLDRSPLAESVRALAGCLIVTVFIAGFPIAIILAWYFDLSRRGIRRDRAGAAMGMGTAMGALGLTVVVTAAFMWQVNPCGLGRVLGVAVLPCGYYGAEEHQYEGAAISAELNYRLSHLPQLQVPAWPSTQYLADQIVAPDELSAALGVDRLVECGVRRSDERLSINLQLYDPAADRNLWADEYVGQATDELLLIAEAFRDLIGVHGINVSARAGGRIERVNEAPTASAEAWALFQRARTTELAGDAAGAAMLQRQALRLDPTFARSQAAVAKNLLLQARHAELSETDRAARLKAAAALTRRALIESPDLSEALMLWRELLGAVKERQEDQSEPNLPTDPELLHETIIQIRPSFAEEFLWWSRWLENQGRIAEAIAARETAFQLDPARLVE